MWYFDRDEHAHARATGTASDDATEALEADAVQRQIGKLEERYRFGPAERRARDAGRGRT